MRNLQQKNYLLIGIVGFLGVFFFLFLLLVVLRVHLDISLPLTEYAFIIPVTFLYLIAFVIVDRNNGVLAHHISIPSAFFLLAMGNVIYLGTIDHYLQVWNDAMFTYDESVTAGYLYICLALTCWIIGYLSNQRIVSKNPSTGKEIVWDRQKLFNMNLFWGVTGIVAFIVLYSFYIKGIPLLEGITGSVSPEIRGIIMSEATTVSVVAFNATSLAIIFSGIYLVNYEKSFAMMAILLSGVGLFSLWGSRLFIALPAMVVLMVLNKKKKYRLMTACVILVLISMSASLYGWMRNRIYISDTYYNSSSMPVKERLSLLHVAPEFRDVLGVVSHLDELQSLYSKWDYVQGIVLTAVPDKLWKLTGIDKKKLFSEEGIGSEWIIAEITRGSKLTAMRAGIIAQTLMAFGSFGLMVVFFILGVLFSHLDTMSRKYNASSVILVYIYLVTVIFGYVSSTTHGMFSKFWYFTYGYLLTVVLVGKRVARDEEAMVSPGPATAYE